MSEHEAGHRRNQHFLWGRGVGALFSSKKLTTFFSRRPQNTYKNAKLTTLTLQIPPFSKKCQKNLTLALPGGALTTFPCKLRPHFFSALEGVRAPPGYSYEAGQEGIGLITLKNRLM